MLKSNNPLNNISLLGIGFGLTSICSLAINHVFVKTIGQQKNCREKNVKKRIIPIMKDTQELSWVLIQWRQGFLQIKIREMNDPMNKSYTVFKVPCISFAIIGIMMMGFTISQMSQFTYAQSYEEISEACGDPDDIDSSDPTAMSQISEMLKCGIEFSKNYNQGTPSSSERSEPNAITTTTVDENGNSWTEYTNSDLGISFEYPASWGLQEKENRFDTSAEALVYDRERRI